MKRQGNRVDFILNKWFIDASVPFHATTSKYHQPMLYAVASYVLVTKGQVAIAVVVLYYYKMSNKPRNMSRVTASQGGNGSWP